jgi:hypothetical protein
MSPTKIDTQPTPIELDLSGAFGVETRLSQADFLTSAAELDPVRQAFLATRADPAPTSPSALLEEYQTDRRNGLLGRILASAKNVRDATDRIVLLASPRCVDLARALFSACCHPFHNDLPRGHRGGRPRFYFASASGDNDALQGLLEALNASADELSGAEINWSLVVVDDATDCEVVAGLSEAFLDNFQQRDPTRAPSAVGICAEASPLAEIAQRYEFATLEIPSAGTAQIHPGVLLAASVMGMDIVKLLRGSAFAGNQFVNSPPGNNAAFDLAVLHRMAAGESKNSAWDLEAHINSLRPLANWLSNCEAQNNAPRFVVQLIAEAVRFDRLRVKLSAKGKSNVYLNELATKQTNAAAEQLKSSGIAVAAIRLKQFDEHAVGQTLATFDLAKQLAARFADEPKP